jgi:uroporphyrinogen-III synthase
VSDLPLSGFRIGVTAARRAEEQIALLERRGAEVVHAPALSVDPNRIDEVALLAATKDVLSTPVDVFLATTGIGMKSWLTAAERWGLLEDLVAHLAQAEILARGPKSVGALRRFGLRELWAPESEEFEDVLAHLRGRDLTGLRIVVQEHGQSLSMAAHAMRRLGADVTTVTVYRVEAADDLEPMFGLVEAVAKGEVDAVTFTAAPAVAAMMEAAATAGHRDDVVSAFQADVIASCVGPVTAAAFEMWDVPSIYPERSRLAAMVKQLETELPSRAGGTSHEDVKVLVAVAHGTRDPAGSRVAAEITSAAGRRLGMTATASYVEICEPLFADVMTGLREPAVVVPLLLSTGYHVRNDLSAAVAGAAAQVKLGRPLGPDLLLAEAQVDRLVAAGALRGQPLVMVAAGSTDPAATADLDEAARLLGDLWAAPVRLATLSGIGTRPAEVVRPGDAVSPYLLAPGFFALRARVEALEAGAAVVADVIGAHPMVVDLVCQRATQLASLGRVPRAAP